MINENIKFLGCDFTIKPWGYEFIVCKTHESALWCLKINKDQSTSFHCHPLKRTGYIVLNGEVQIEFMSSIKILKKGEYINFRKGLFHGTKSLSNSSILLEIESPDNKEDLIRLEDSSGRKTSKIEEPYNEIIIKNEILFENEFKKIFHESEKVNILDFNIELLHINNIEQIIKINNEKSFIMILMGTVLTNNKYPLQLPQRLIGTADVISVKNLLRMKNIIDLQKLNLKILLFTNIY